MRIKSSEKIVENKVDIRCLISDQDSEDVKKLFFTSRNNLD